MSESPKRRLLTKKILVAAVGVGAVSYVIACGETTSDSSSTQTGDAAAGDGAAKDSGQDSPIVSSGNLMPPPPADATDAPPDVIFFDVSSGNLMPPPPVDAGDASKDSPSDG